MRHFGPFVSYVIISLFVCLIACNQNKSYSESLLRTQSVILEQPDSALWILENEIDPDKLSGRQYADWCLFITQARDKNNIEQTSDSLIRQAKEYYEKHHANDKDRLMLIYYYCGRIADNMRLAPRAQEYYKKALETGKGSNDYYTKALTCNYLGTLYTYQYAYDSAIPYLKEAHQYFTLLTHVEGISYSLRNIARVHHQKEQLDSARYYYERAINVYHSNTQGGILRELSEVVFDQGDYETALQYIKNSIPITTNPTELYSNYLILGKVYFGLGQLDSATTYLNKSLPSNQPTTVASANYYLSQIAERRGYLREGWKLLNNYIQLWDAIEKTRNHEVIQQVETMYNFQQLEQETEEYRLQSAIAKQSLLWVALVAVITIALLIIYLLHIRAQRKNLNNQRTLLLRFVDRQRRDSKEQLLINKDRLTEIERKDLPNDVILNLEKSLLESENNRILQDIDKQKGMQIELTHQKNLNKFHNGERKDITDEDIVLLKQTINLQHPNFEVKLIENDLFSNGEICYLCYLIKADIKLTQIAKLMFLSQQSLANKRKTLFNKIQDNYPFVKTFDEFIKLL